MRKPMLIAVGFTLALAANASAQVLLGDFENGSLDSFFSWTPANATLSTGPKGATLGSDALKYALSAGTGYHQGTAISLGNIGSIPAFLANGLFSVDMTYDSAEFAGAGTYDSTSLVINAPGLGFVDIGRPTTDTGNPGFTGGWDGTNYPGITTRTMTWDYGSRLASISPNPGYLELIFVHASNYTSTVHYFDNIRLSVSTEPNWKLNGSGDWNVAGNWANITVPNAVGATANLIGSITSNQTVYSNTAVTVGTLNINNANTYVLAGAGSLTMDVSSGSAAINVLAGSQKINLPLTLNDNTTATIAAGATLTIADPLTLANSSILTAAGAGTLNIISTVTNAPGTLTTSGATVNAAMDLNTGTSLRMTAGALNLNATQHVKDIAGTGGTVRLATGSKLIRTDSVALTGAAGLDLTDGRMIIDYSGSTSFASVRSQIVSGYNAGTWTGSGIRSSTAAADLKLGVGVIEAGSRTSFAGESIDSTTLLIATTLKGDTNLNFAVDFDDLLSLAQAYGGAGQWVNGDTNYTGSVDFDDLLALAQNYGATLLADGSISIDGSAQENFAADFALARSMVPEPTSAAVLLVAATGLRRRR